MSELRIKYDARYVVSTWYLWTEGRSLFVLEFAISNNFVPRLFIIKHHYVYPVAVIPSIFQFALPGGKMQFFIHMLNFLWHVSIRMHSVDRDLAADALFVMMD